MAAPSFSVEVVTPTRLVLKMESTSIIAPGVEGYLGILANHAPLLTELKVGKLTIKDTEGNEQYLAVSGGFMEVKDNKVTILADTAEKVEEIDIARAEEARRRAEERINQGGSEVDMVRAQAALARAVNRLELVESIR